MINSPGDYICIVYCIVEDYTIFDNVPCAQIPLTLITSSGSLITKICCTGGHRYNNCWYPIGIFATHVELSSLFYADFNNVSVPYHIAVQIIQISNN